MERTDMEIMDEGEKYTAARATQQSNTYKHVPAMRGEMYGN